MLAAWKADQKVSGSNLLSLLLYFFISNRKDMGLNPLYSKFVNSVCTNKKLSLLYSLLQNNYLTKNQSFFFLCKNVLLQKYYHPITYPVPFICARSMPQHRKKYSTSKDYLSLLVYLYLLVYAPYTLWELLFKINCSAFGNVSLQNMTEPNAGKRGIGFKKPTVIGIKNASSPVFRVS